MPTNLGKKQAGPVQASAPARSRLATRLALQGDRGEDVELAGGLGPAWLALIGSEEVELVEAAVIKLMAERGLEPTVLNALAYDAARARFTLARAVRAPDDHEAAFGSLFEWGRVDPDTLAAVWIQYADMRSRLSPLDVGVNVTPEQRAEILEAISKKNAMLLLSYDVRTLVSFLLSMASPLETSPTPTSTTGPSQSEP